MLHNIHKGKQSGYETFRWKICFFLRIKKKKVQKSCRFYFVAQCTNNVKN